jgi:predicted kinase
MHGDLHAEHICFAPEGIEIFDCIEFSPELRRCDVASEVAFLAMDLCVRGGRELMETFIAQYLKWTNDLDLRKLLPFYCCYRALVRAKVHALRLGCWNDETARYFRSAVRFTWEPMKPFVVLVCGLTGSGKSTVARELAARLNLRLINSDVVRKQMASKSGQQTVPLNEGIYSPAMTEKTYAGMVSEAKKQLVEGQGVILDATFGRRSQRERVVELAEQYGAPFAVIHCSAPPASIEQRLKERSAAGTDISDGRWEIYLAQKTAGEPLDEIPLGQRFELNTDQPIGDLADASEAFLRAQLNHRDDA